MSEKYELNLLENALDSLREALKKHKDGRNEDPRAFKFCVLHLVHFVELFLKHCVAEEHRLLIYTKPHNVNPESRTITLDQSIATLESCGYGIQKNLRDDIEWLQKLRHKIQHFQFSITEDEVDEYIGRVFDGVIAFSNEHEIFNFSNFLEEIEGEIDLSLEDIERYREFYKDKLKRAKEEAEDVLIDAAGGRLKHTLTLDWEITNCPNCSHPTVIVDHESETGYRCTYCGETDPDEYEVEGFCSLCGMNWSLADLVEVDWTDEGHIETACPRCRGDPEYVSDD